MAVKSIFISVLFLPLFAVAGTISNLVVDSNTASLVDDSADKLRVVGGFAGECTTDTPTATATCDSCLEIPDLCTTTRYACNRKTVHANLNLSFTFTVDQVPDGSRILVKMDDTEIPLPSGNASTTLSANSSLFVKIPWGSICTEADGTLSGDYCYGSFAKDLFIGVSNGSESSFSSSETVRIVYRGIDPTDASVADFHTYCATDSVVVDSGQGFCRFNVFPGDKKVYVENLQRASATPTGALEVAWNAVRFYFEPNFSGDPCTINPATSAYADIDIVDKVNVETTLVSNKVDGLTNEVDYGFLMSTVDEAQNVTFFTDSADFDTNIHTARPGEVVGLLDSEKCFVATAAYGTELDPEIEILRKFRSNVLLKTEWGQKFVSWYYLNSPAWAHTIEKHPWLKSVVRAALWPIVSFLKWIEPAYAQERPSDPWGEPIVRPDPEPEFEPMTEEEKGYGTIPADPNYNRYPETQPFFKKPEGPKQGGVQKVPHPGAAKGLIRINKDGSYQYRVATKEKSKAGAIKLISMTPPEISNGDGSITYESMYGSQNITGFMFDYEWQPFRGFGSLGLQLGIGFAAARANGTFLTPRPGGITEAKEVYSFYVLPLSAFVVYRFEYFKRQWFVPYINGGASYYGLIEARDDGGETNFAGSPAAGGGGGIHINISRWGDRSSFALSEEYGIADMWLTLEARAMKGLNQDLDFTNTSVHAGITVDY